MGIFSCIYSALQGFRSSYILYKGFQESSFSEFISMMLSSAIALLMLIASATVSDGLNVWCNSVTDEGNMTISCRDAQEEPLNLRGVNPLFYDHFGTAQFGLWCAWVVWIVLAFLAFLKISHSCNRDDVSLRYKETLLTQQSQGFHGNVTSVFV
ncbi:transmembrane protein 179 [Callorhinchus milii]|nr:transmembrane protein 179 [Callorhinchus milii]|eukprot:gi/632961153/ref/XP_007896599.1/ PREDICTED: transmembrane protein 179-like [Callorhinchus milii]